MKIKSVLFGLSLFLNGFFILMFVFASLSKTSNVTFFSPGDGYITAAAVASFPQGGSAVFELVEISLCAGEKAFLQFTVVSDRKQGNMLLNALYDPEIIQVSHTGYGIEIFALSEGSTLMQILSNDGIKDVALINVLRGGRP